MEADGQGEKLEEAERGRREAREMLGRMEEEARVGGERLEEAWRGGRQAEKQVGLRVEGLRFRV